MSIERAEFARIRQQLAQCIDVFKAEGRKALAKHVGEAERDEVENCVFMLGLSGQKALMCADQLAQTTDDVGVGTLAMLLERVVNLVAVTSVLSRHFDVPTATHRTAAVKADGTRRAKPGANKRVLNKKAAAEKVRGIIEAAERKPDRPDLFADPEAVLKEAREKLKNPRLHRNTLNGYREHVDSTVKSDGPHVLD